MGKVFISYSHVDKEYADMIIAILDKYKVPYFIDEKSIEWGRGINATIEKVMDNSITHEIVILSPASLKSQWVSYEIGYAKAKGIEVLPYLIHPSLDVPLFIADANYVTDLKMIENYFSKFQPYSKTINIMNVDGSMEECELLVSFKFRDNGKEYIVFTRNEIDEARNITVYVSRVEIENGIECMQSIEDEKEWEKVVDVLKELSKDEGNGGRIDISNVDIFGTDGLQII